MEQAIGAQASSQAAYSKAFRQFFLQPNGTEEDDHSQMQSADVNSMVTAVTAQMVISFATDSVVEFEADNQEDEQASQAESRAVARILGRDSFRQLLDGVQNALLYRNGYMKVWWEVDQRAYTVTHEQIEPEEVPIATEQDVGVQRRLIKYDRDDKTARVEVTETSKRLSMEAVANDRFFVDSDWDRQSFENCPLAGEVHYKTRDELSRMGVDWEKVKDLKAVQRGSGQEKTKRRRGIGEAGPDPITMQMDVCRVYEVYARYNEDDEEDRAYLYRCWLGETGDWWLMEPEIRDRMPYATGSAFPVANQHQGESLAEKLYWIQEGKTELLRQWQDNVRNCSYGRFGVVVGAADAGDVLKPKPGGPVRMKQPNAITPIPIIDVGPSIGAALQYLDQQRSERGGAALDMVQAEAQIASDTAWGTERVYAAKELLVSYMTRNLAESMVRNAYLLGHAELRAGDNGPISFKQAEKWVTVDPANWPERTWCSVQVAPSMGERMHQNTILATMINWYMQLLPVVGDQLVTMQGLYKLLCDWLRLGLVDNVESYFLDPTSEQAQAAGKAKADQAQAAQAAAQQVEELKSRDGEIQDRPGHGL